MKRLVILKPDAVREKRLGRLIENFEDLGEVVRIERRTLKHDEVTRIYHEHVGRDYWQRHFDHMLSGDCILIVVVFDGTDADWLMQIKNSWRAGRVNPENLLHVEDTENQPLLDFLFSHHHV